ncbi:unnamed protein product [Paramecium sonneborni]|uniref:WD40-repeat-containing domain n=1 Tax=Paramecium sonneborni TaxID=65129 RepID=A0A8S1RTH9_9CILI|nr:unnamed protein product [Paramecium sonneborni]
MNCTYHIQNQVSFICIASHKCQYQRKLCAECLYDHGVDVIKQTVPIDRFGAMVIKKLKESKLEETSELIQQRMNFKSIFSKIEIMMKKIWEESAQSIKKIYDMIEHENKQYINLIYDNRNLAESSYNNLEILVSILEGNTLDSWNVQKNLQLKKLEKAKNWLSQEVNAFNEKIKNELDQLNIIGQPQLSNFVQEVKSQIKTKMRDKIQIESQEEEQHQQQSLINQQQQFQQLQQQNQIKSPSQFNLKPFNYQIIQKNSIKQDEWCLAVDLNKDGSILAAGCNTEIKIYEFKQGMLKLNQILNKHKTNVYILNFMKQSNQLISGDQGGSILIWSYNNNSWICLQTIKGHSDFVRCLIMNNKEDLFISSSDDNSIKFWLEENGWSCQQKILDHSNSVYQLSLNEQQNQVISCGEDSQILVIEQSELNKNWIVKQKIKVDCEGYRLCFINDNLFTFQPCKGNLMYVYEKNSISKQFTKSKNITINQSNQFLGGLFPQQFIKQNNYL